VLSGDASAGVNARVHDLCHRLVHPLALLRIVRAIRDVGVQVPIPSVKHVAHEDPVLLADGVDRREDLGQTGAGNHRVLNDEMGCKPSHSPKGLLASLPQL